MALPVRLSLLGSAYFLVLVLLLASCLIGPSAAVERVWKSLVGAGFAVSCLLTLYSIGFLHAACFWCLVVFTSLAALTVLAWRKGRGSLAASGLSPYAWGAIPFGSVAAGLALAFFQPSVVTELVLRPGASDEIRNFPIIGHSRKAESALVVDFACPHCRQTLSALASSGTSFYLVPISTDKPESGVLSALFASARRQGFADRFCARIPPNEIPPSWIEAIRQEIGVTQGDMASAVGLAKRSATFASRHGLTTVPVTVTFSK
ncbi:hypothetical protein BH11ARM2_BH11ARM2_21420 [soil metagenome]